MATVLGVNATKAANPTPNDMIPGGESAALICRFFDSFVTESTANGTIIKMCGKLPKGYKVVGFDLQYDALGTSTTLKLGDEDDDDRYLAAVSTASAGIKNTPIIGSVNYAIGTNDGDEQVILTLGGADATDARNIVLQMYLARK